jgi:hypothetical protein
MVSEASDLKKEVGSGTAADIMADRKQSKAKQ